MSEGSGKQRKRRTKMARPTKSQSLEDPVEGAYSRLNPLLFRSKTYDPTFARETEKEAGSSQHRNSVPTAVSPMKHAANFHQVFKDISEEEELLDTFSCAWQQEVPYHGCLYVSHNHVCFHCSMLWREVKVTIPVPTISVLKKANTALLVPNAICIRTAEGDKFLFGSLRSRETAYQLLRSVCKHLQDGSRNSSPTPPGASSDHLKISLISKEFDPNNTAPEQQTPLEEPGEAGGLQEQSKAEPPETAANRGGRRPTKSSRSRGVLLCPLNTVILIYLFLVVILLLSSGYIGFRIVQLERELISMGAWPELDLQHQ